MYVTFNVYGYIIRRIHQASEVLKRESELQRKDVEKTEVIQKLYLYHWFSLESFSLFSLTHMCQVDLSILINWTSQFPNLGVSGVLFYFYSISNRNSCKQTVQTQIRRCRTWRLIWVCTVCQIPPKMGY